MKAAMSFVGIFALLAAPVMGGTAVGDDSSALPATVQYDFMLGEWDLEAATMQPDQSLMAGSGTMNVYTIHDGQTLQADMRVSFEDGSGFIGSTMRTYDFVNENWAVSWVPAGAQTAGGAVAFWQGDRMIETWPMGEDQHGAFENTVELLDIAEDRFVVSMDRHYVNGPTIEGVWRYVATRRDASDR